MALWCLVVYVDMAPSGMKTLAYFPDKNAQIPGRCGKLPSPFIRSLYHSLRHSLEVTPIDYPTRKFLSTMYFLLDLARVEERKMCALSRHLILAS